MPSWITKLVLPAMSVIILMLCACSSSNNNATASNSSSNKSSTNSTNIATQSNTAANQPAASGKQLSDCDYGNQVLKALTAIGGGTAAGASTDKSSIAAIVSGANSSLTSLKNITPPNDFKQFHADFVKAVQDVVTQMQDAQKSVDAGDPAKATTTLTSAETNFEKQADSLQAKYPALSKRLDACPSGTP
jgi:hypothetical protein